MKSITLKLLVLSAVLLSNNTVSAAKEQLNLFIWSEYIDPKVVADFEKQFDCKVTIDLYEDESAMMAKLQGGGASAYDVVVPPDHKVAALIKLNLIAPLRHENIPNLNNLDEKFRNPPYDRGNKYTAAYQWGTVGLYVRNQRGQRLADSWGLVFDPKLAPGRFVLIDNSRDMIGAALKYRGYSLNSTNPAQLKEARDLVLAAKKRSAGFENSVGGKNKVLGKSVRAAIVYSGEAARGITDDKQTSYVLPREGSQIWQDNLAVLAKAPHRDMAEKFVNFLLDARNGARISNFTQFATPNKAAIQFVNPEDLRNPAIYPPADILSKLEFLEDLGANSRLYDEVWTQIKSK
jgi:spermidine/putrescine transport system substrate-binding protein